VTDVEALSAAVGVENQAIYGYGLAGARLLGRERARALAALDSHRVRRDQLVAMLSRLGATPAFAPPAYAAPSPVTDATSARDLCATLEDACAGAAWDLVSSSPPASRTRSLGVGWLTDAAVAAAAWRRGTVAGNPSLPGQPD
jgi:hypothetical protein